MPTALTATCPVCKTTVSDDDRVCATCGAAVGAWPDIERAPLILPGNPALSEDLVRSRFSVLRVFGASVVGAGAIFGWLYLTSADEREAPPLLIAQAAGVSSSAAVDSAGAAPAAAPVVVPRDTVKAVAPNAIAAADSLPPIADALKNLTPEPAIAAPPAAAIVAKATPAAVATPAPKSVAVAPTVVAKKPVALATPVPKTVAIAPTVVKKPVSVPATSRNAVLRMVRLVSDSLRPGELLQLRWSVQDRTTRRVVPGAIEFTSSDATIASVDRRTGVVSARAPGSVRIIADAGTAGRNSLNLVVRAAAPVVAVRQPADAAQTRTESARSASTLGAAPVAPAPAAPRPAVVASPVAAAPSVSAFVREARRVEPPDAGDVRSAVYRVVSEVERGNTRDAQLRQFLADGDGHRAALVSAPTTISSGPSTVRVTFEMRLTKFDGGGRPVTRLASVAMDVEKHDATISSSAIAVGALRKP